jgi:hypothetical protein
MLKAQFFVLLCLSTLVCFSRGLRTENDTASGIFEDINIFKLTGVNRLSSIKYPYVEIKSAKNKRIVTYHIKKGSTKIKEYSWSGEHWQALDKNKGDTCRLWLTYEFVLPNKILEFTYCDTSTWLLHDFNIISESKSTAYVLDPGRHIKPSVENTQMAMKYAAYKHEEIMTYSGQHVMLRTLRTEKNNNRSVDLNYCYLASRRYTFVWLQYFWSSLRSVDCK